MKNAPRWARRMPTTEERRVRIQAITDAWIMRENHPTLPADFRTVFPFLFRANAKGYGSAEVTEFLAMVTDALRFPPGTNIPKEAIN